jgi:hypothetical protein
MVRGIANWRGVNWWPALPLAAAFGPAVFVASLECVTMARAAAGEHPRWPTLQLTLSEATAVRDNAEVMRLLERGDDPNRRYSVRPGLVDNERPVMATPIEAAISNRRSDLVELLLTHGARLTDADWTRLRCVATAYEDHDLEAALDSGHTDAKVARCAGDERLW